MLIQQQLDSIKSKTRVIEEPNDDNAVSLGPLAPLAGTWKGSGTGWNMIALPFVPKTPQSPPYRLLLNQYDEVLKFGPVHVPVPNRGIDLKATPPQQTDQMIAAIEYNQSITQVDADDFPNTGTAQNDNGAVIHGEPGLWLHITNENTNGLDLARLGTIPHGNSLLALGTHKTYDGAPVIPEITGIPTGLADSNLNNKYLEPYKHFHDSPFMGNSPVDFDPTQPNSLLRLINQGVDIKRTTEITVDTTLEDAGIVNIPFIVKQANAAAMKFTFWIQELAETDKQGNPKIRLQYSQVVMLDFFSKNDGAPGRIAWPHVSINTLDKVATPYAHRA